MMSKKVYYKLITKVNTIDTKMRSTSGLITKTHYDSYKQSPTKSSRLAHKLLNNTGLNILGNEEILEKSQN